MYKLEALSTYRSTAEVVFSLGKRVKLAKRALRALKGKQHTDPRDGEENGGSVYTKR